MEHVEVAAKQGKKGEGNEEGAEARGEGESGRGG